MFLIADDIKALKSTWIIGEQFVKDLDQSLTSININSEQPNGMKKLYLTQNYNVLTYHSTRMSKPDPFLARVHNSLVDALNKDNYLPRYIIIILDKDLIVNADLYNYGVS